MEIIDSELEIPLGLEEMVPDLAGTSRLIVLTESALEFPLDLEGDLEGDLERDLDLEFELELEALEALETLSTLDARVSERTGTSRVVDHSEAASEAALALDVLVVLIDAVDLRLGTSTGKIEYLDSFE